MIPTLQKVILNGASRHCLKKGFILVGDQPVDTVMRDRIVQAANKMLSNQIDLPGFVVETRPTHISLIGLTTPFLPIYDVSHRDFFFVGLAKAVGILARVVEQYGYHLTAAGMNPLVADSDKLSSALCADLHQVEIFDDGEIERVYNLYRQFLPELLAISTHSAVYGGELQKDFSVRMRINPASFLPRYISQFSAKQLDKLRSMMRRDYGLSDLKQMDINPLAGDPGKLTQENPSLLSNMPPAAELRFIDAQCSYPFIRAQLIIFQAIAMYGRSLARLGKRLPYMRDEVIDENKALTIQSGAGAVLKPDPKFKKDDGGGGFFFHDTGLPERVTTSLLMIMDGLLLPYLRELECQYREIAPIVLGAELRRRGRQCFANYAEYQKYLHYTNPGRFKSIFQEHVKILLSSTQLDFITDFNRKTQSKISTEIEEDWQKKLNPKSRYKGEVKHFDAQKEAGFIQAENGQKIHFRKSDIEGVDRLYDNQPVTFEMLERRGQLSAIRVRAAIQERYEGSVARFIDEKGFGFIRMQGREEVFVHTSDIIDGQKLIEGDIVSFEFVENEKRSRALRVKLKERPSKKEHPPKRDRQDQPRQKGRVKWFDMNKRYGYITTDSNEDAFVHQEDLIGIDKIEKDQEVSFVLKKGDKGLKAIYVGLLDKE